MVTNNEIMIQVKADAADATNNLTSMSNKVENQMTNMSTSIKNALSTCTDKLTSFSNHFNNLNNIMGGVTQTLGGGSFKSLTVDLAMSRDQMKNLLAVTMQGSDTFEVATQKADSFINTMREGTSGSVVKLSMMIDAMNGIKLSTGMANESLESLNDVIRTVGEASLLMGDDTEHATFVMKEAMAGLNGDFTVLKEQFGITKEKMKDMGWSGQADDIEGYRKALEQCLSGLGDMGQVMDTTSGKISKIKSSFSSAGMKIGETFLPAIDALATGFLKANENGNILTNGILYIGGAASVLSSLDDAINPYINSLKDMADLGQDAYDAIKLVTDGTRGLQLAQKLATATQLVATDGKIADSAANTMDAATAGLNSEANVGLAASFKLAARGALEFAAALLTNPLFWVAAAVVAVVAILWHLYNTNEQVREGINNLASTIQGGLMQAWDMIVQGVTSVYQYLEQLGQIIYSLLVPAWQQITTELQPLWQALQELGGTFQELWETLNGAGGPTHEAGSSLNYIAEAAKLLGGIIVGLSQVIIILVQGALAIIIPYITAIVSSFKVFIGVINDVLLVISQLATGQISLGDAIGEILNIFSNAGPQLQTIVHDMIQSIVDNFRGVFSSLAPAIQEEMQNIYDAILNTPILGAIVQLAADILQGFLDMLGIHSPGFMANAIQEEMGHIAEFITGSIGNIINAITELTMNILTIFMSLPTQILQTLISIGTMIQLQLNQLWITIVTLVTGIVQGILTRFRNIIIGVQTIFTNIVQSIRTRLSQGIAVAGAMAGMIRNAIITRFNLIVARARQIFQNIVNAIRSKLVSAVSSAKQKAKEIYDGIVNKIKELPGKVGEEIGSLATTIKNKLVDAGVKAFEGAKHLVAQFLAGMGIASPGTIQRKTRSEFMSLPEIISSTGIIATKATGNMASNIVNTWNQNMKNGLTIPEIDTNSLKDIVMPEIISTGTLTPTINDFLKQSATQSLQYSLDTINPNNIDLQPIATPLPPNRLLGQTTNNNQSTNNNINNQEDNRVVYNLHGDVIINAENMQQNEKEFFYKLLDTISPGSA